MTASDETSVTNSLQTKLQTKLLVSPSVINTQQLHRHSNSHHAMANRLLQRLALPEQITSRYNAGILSTEVTRSPAQKFQRKESFAEVRPLVNATVVQRAANSPTNPQWEQNDEPSNPSTQYQELTASVPPKQPYTAPVVNSSETSVFQRLSEQNSIHASPELPSATYRISRRASNLDVFAETNISNANDSVSESPNNLANNLALSPPPSLPLASSPETTSSPYRISRRPASFDNSAESNASLLPLASSDAIADSRTIASVNTSLPTPIQAFGGSIQAKTQPQVDNHRNLSEKASSLLHQVARKPTASLSPTISNSTSFEGGSDIVGSPTNRSDVTIQRKYYQSQLLQRSSETATGLLVSGGEPQISTRMNNFNGNTDLIARRANTPTVVQTKPLPLFNQSQATEDISQSRGDGILANSLDLPLAISSNHNMMVSRQNTSATVESMPSETINAIPTPTASVNSVSANSGIDIAEVAEKVSRIILRRLQVERERRGVSR